MWCGHTTVVRSSAQVIHHAGTILLRRQSHLKPSMVAGLDVGWMALPALVRVAGHNSGTPLSVAGQGCLTAFSTKWLTDSSYHNRSPNPLKRHNRQDNQLMHGETHFASSYTAVSANHRLKKVVISTAVLAGGYCFFFMFISCRPVHL